MMLTVAILTGLFAAASAQNHDKAPIDKPNPPRQDHVNPGRERPKLEKSTVSGKPNEMPNDKGPKAKKMRPKKRDFKNTKHGHSTPPIIGGHANQTDRKSTINQAPKKN